jgi:hypothetical protein
MKAIPVVSLLFPLASAQLRFNNCTQDGCFSEVILGYPLGIVPYQVRTDCVSLQQNLVTTTYALSHSLYSIAR